MKEAEVHELYDKLFQSLSHFENIEKNENAILTQCILKDRSMERKSHSFIKMISMLYMRKVTKMTLL